MAKNVTIALGGSVAEEGKPGSRHLIRVIHLIGLDIIIYNDIQKNQFYFLFFSVRDRFTKGEMPFVRASDR